MERNPYQQVLQVKCKEHNTASELLFLTNNQVQHRICMTCFKQKRLAKENVLFVKDLIEAAEDTILPFYPPLENQALQYKLDKVAQYSSRQQLDAASQFFNELKTDIDAAIEKAKLTAKKILSEIAQKKKKVVQVYNEISSKNELKQEVLDASVNGNEKRIHNLIARKFQECEQNCNALINPIAEFQDSQGKFSLEQPRETKQKVIKLIEDICFAKSRSILEKIEFFGTNLYESMDCMKISRIENEAILIERILRDNWWGIARSSVPLSTQGRYVFRFQYDQESGGDFPGFEVRLAKQGDNLNTLQNSNISYLEYSQEKGQIKRSIRGADPLSSGERKRYLHKSFELRIHLAANIIRISDYPQYENVVELESPVLLDNKQKYNLEFVIKHLQDRVTIKEAYFVGDFDSKM